MPTLAALVALFACIFLFGFYLHELITGMGGKSRTSTVMQVAAVFCCPIAAFMLLVVLYATWAQVPWCVTPG